MTARLSRNVSSRPTWRTIQSESRSKVQMRNHFGPAPVVPLHPPAPLLTMQSGDRPALNRWRPPVPMN